MPFWEQVQRCQNCRFWRQTDPSNTEAICAVEHEMKQPFWHMAIMPVTRWDEGTACRVYRHDANKPHLLDDAPALLALVEVGDRLPMRTYRIGDVDHAIAEVVHRNNTTVTVRMLNGTYRIRIRPTEHHYGGTVMDMEEWGIDVHGSIERAATVQQQPGRANEMLFAVKVGDLLPLVGYPPFTGMRKTGRVMAISDKYLTIRIGQRRRKAKMHHKGPLAGIIEGEVWTLDTSGE